MNGRTDGRMDDKFGCVEQSKKRRCDFFVGRN